MPTALKTDFITPLLQIKKLDLREVMENFIYSFEPLNVLDLVSPKGK